MKDKIIVGILIGIVIIYFGVMALVNVYYFFGKLLTFIPL